MPPELDSHAWLQIPLACTAHKCREVNRHLFCTVSKPKVNYNIPLARGIMNNRNRMVYCVDFNPNNKDGLYQGEILWVNVGEVKWAAMRPCKSREGFTLVLWGIVRFVSLKTENIHFYQLQSVSWHKLTGPEIVSNILILKKPPFYPRKKGTAS